MSPHIDVRELAETEVSNKRKGRASAIAKRASTPLISPAALRQKRPLLSKAQSVIYHARQTLKARIEKGEGAPIAIVGPCSVHCESAVLEYAERLARLQSSLEGRVQIVMRVYFEKPRTVGGWKGFLYDPDLDGSCDLPGGLERARTLMLRIADMGLPMATEILDPMIAEYLGDCLSWVAIGARSSESQIHRQIASDLSCPVGFKNGTTGSVEGAIHACQSARNAHSFFGIDDYGSAAMRHSCGNSATHLVLRGGTGGTNFNSHSVGQCFERARSAGLNGAVLVDCSHGNSEKDYRRQPVVAREVIRQILRGRGEVLGLMLESHLLGGNQAIESPRTYGLSVTDACIDFCTTEKLLRTLSEARSE